jgi:Ca-activated chloride channel family protein
MVNVVSIILLLVAHTSSAGVLDFLTIDAANSAYHNQEYNKAEQLYQGFTDDYGKLNYGNSLYKQAKYQEAIDAYQSITPQHLSFERAYNMGNGYAKLKQFDKAIASYEAALNIQDDANATYNLELVKKLKQQQNKQQQNNNNSGQNQKNASQNTQDNKSNSQQKNTNKNKNQQNKQQQQAEQQKKLDRLQQKKWEKALRKKVQTLMLPLDNKKLEDNDEKNNSW